MNHQKRGEYRNPALLKFCHTVDCTVESPYCNGREVVPCHSNMGDDGHGRGIKADDLFVAAGCGKCHDFLDRRGKDWKAHDRDEIQWYHDRGIKRTLRLAVLAGVKL